jgi:uncharacterized protein (TIGR00297 family)
VSAIVAGLAWRSGTLTISGAWAAWGVGLVVLLGAGWAGGAILAAFFVSSNLVSRGAPRPAGMDPKGERRDHRQVLANGGAAALGALAGRHLPELGLWLVTGSLAAAAADTWATAVGARSRRAPHLFWSGQAVAPGTNGGMTWLGSVAAAAGALTVAAVGALGGRQPLLLPVATLIGFAGMLVDSALGAGLQGRFHCPACDRPSEWRVHRCGATTVPQGGLPWLDNDLVNLAASTTAAGLTFAAWLWLCPCS